MNTPIWLSPLPFVCFLIYINFVSPLLLLCDLSADSCYICMKSEFKNAKFYPLFHVFAVMTVVLKRTLIVYSVILYFSDLNARMRAIDLLCSLLAPLTVGLIMSYTSLLVSAIVIAGWNVFSVVVEYSLLSRVYRLVPRLAVKEDSIQKVYESVFQINFLLC